ncbi:MAG: 1-hydroxycarotenoid 3,4-desaturase CrtD [Sphingomonadaceae bacterium]
MRRERVIIVGAGVGGLTSALLLAHAGCDVTVIDKASAPGGKMRQLDVGDCPVDAGPTVFTMRHVFDAVFESVGESLDQHLTLTKANILARHAWNGASRLDLFADRARSRDAIGDFAGAVEARAFDSFSRQARAIFDTLDESFMRASKTSALGLSLRIGARDIRGLFGIRPFDPLWRALGRHFSDPRLLQLFGRYATYAGSSPFKAPATLMLIAEAEARGVYLVDGGMHQLAVALEQLSKLRGARFRYGEACQQIDNAGVTLRSGERIEGDLVVANCDPAALSAGLLGEGVRRAVKPYPTKDRALSALVTLYAATTHDFPLVRHNVFFSDDYAAEFADIDAGRLPRNPTVYVCAQDRGADDNPMPTPRDRLQFIVNAPATGDARSFSAAEIIACQNAALDKLKTCGLTLTVHDSQVTTPGSFNQLFPATGGALYGRATHGAMSAFQRPGARSRLPWLYLCGGGTHPGAGVPMAALSGIQAASALLADRASTRRSFRVAMPGGTSTRSATMGNSA